VQDAEFLRRVEPARVRGAARPAIARAIPPPAAAELHVWWASPEDATEPLAALLDHAEQARLDRIRRSVDRDRFLVGVALSRLGLAAYLGEAPERIAITRTCPRCGRPHGRPQVVRPRGPRLEFSVSHAGNRVAVAFARHPVGVDVEPLRPVADVEPLLASVLAPVEAAAIAGLGGDELTRAFLVYWTRKEAVAKALGIGLSQGLEELVVSVPSKPARVVSAPLDPSGVVPTVADVDAGPDHVAAVAVLSSTAGTRAVDGAAAIAAWLG
jgi:4'-phosphopantetheinyl transferase